jgi:RTC4-like domain
MDFITREFSDALRDRIGSDRLIAARDVSGYVQMVLAPELATRLIMEDMKLSKEEARDIMAESAGLGDLLHGSTEEDKSHDK